MPVQFLTPEQRAHYGRYVGDPSADQLACYFYLDDTDHAVIGAKRGDHNRLGFALQLTTARFLGTFLEDPLDVPDSVLQTLSRQLQVTRLDQLSRYRHADQRWAHAAEIRPRYGFSDWSHPTVGFRLSRWLYALCWTGTEQSGVLFNRATAWLLAHKVLLPGCTTLERFVNRLRSRVENRLWKRLGRHITDDQRQRLEALLTLSPQGRGSWLDQLRSGPVRVSGRALVQAIIRLQTIRDLGIELPAAGVPSSRLASLARFTGTAKVSAISRLPPVRRLATLVAFIHCLEATAQDDVMEVLDRLLHEFFSDAAKADKKARFRSLKDLDQAASVLAAACRTLLDPALADSALRDTVFAHTPPHRLAQALACVDALVRPPDDVYYRELDTRYRALRLFLPTLLRHIQFGASPAGEPVAAGFEWLRMHELRVKPEPPAPRDVITKPWQRYVLREHGGVNPRAYTFCVLDELCKALRRRDVFVSPSWRYADPRAGLLTGEEWETARPIICRSLGLSADPVPTLAALAMELDQTYRAVARRLPDNPAVRFETVDGRKDLVLSPLDKLDEPESLIKLREAVVSRLPVVDLPEILLEIAVCTGFTDAFTHLTERTARAQDLNTSLCAVLLAEACNTGPEPLVRHDVPALRRERLAWVNQNYLRDDTLTAANARLVAAQNRVPLAQARGSGEVASADGLRFVVPVRTVHAGPNPKYFGYGQGVTWYNLMSDQCSGLNAITVPGTLRDSLILLAVVLEQQTELQPAQIMTDTGAYSDVVFGLFRLLGYRFSPRLADIGGTRFWRLDAQADYGELNALARQRVALNRIVTHWDDLLRLVGSLKLGRVPATGIMRTLQVGDRPTQLALALAEFGRIEKTLHALNYIDDENRRRATLLQLNRTEGRHSLARDVFHGKRGELRQRYREGQEDQLGALGLVVNIIVLWNTLYMDAALAQLRQEGYPVRDEDVARLSPFIHERHINLLGRYSFAVPEAVTRGELRPLRDPNDADA
ncbi:Tn3 family transposase [Methylobacter sp.]|uniref:Tn3 family transposase n=1 Tax=Methylobacter sp. TaxID=2051955 RepID=UPI003DA3F36B